MCFLLNLNHCVKCYGHFCQILALSTMPVDQICSCHVTQDASFCKYFFLILHLILGKVTKFPVENISTSEVISKKPHGGWKTPPRTFRVNAFAMLCLLLIHQFPAYATIV